jgi:dUTP pyrophosphatase
MKFIKKTFLIKFADGEGADLEFTNFYKNHGAFHKDDAGLDLYIKDNVTIAPGHTVLVDLGVQCQCDSFNPRFWQWPWRGVRRYHSYYLIPRSSISKTPLIMRNSIGLIDASYTGNIKAPLYNTSNEPFTLKKGQRYVQLVNSDLSGVSLKLVNNLRDTRRGAGGFGSTGR